MQDSASCRAILRGLAGRHTVRPVTGTHLTDFEKWLTEHRLLPEKRIGYAVGWVQRFLRARVGRPREEWRDTLSRFLRNLEGGSVEDWQLRQAAEAITIYCTQYRVQKETALSPVGDGPPLKTSTPATPQTPREALLEMRRLMQLRHYAPRTERSYLGWARRFLRHLRLAGASPTRDEVEAYLTHLATVRNVSASTQKQAFSALLFLCRNVFFIDLKDLHDTVRARRGPKLPVVLSVEETRTIIDQLRGTSRLMLELVYGGGLRVSEVVQLRIKDIDFDQATVTVRSGKGDRDRSTFLPARAAEDLRQHLGKVKVLHERDVAAGAGEAPMPSALSRKYPNAGREWAWQFAFPSSHLTPDDDGTIRRWHVAAATVQKAMKTAVRKSGVPKSATVHALRHSFATHLLMKGVDIRQIQDLLGHSSVETTMVYTHVIRSMRPDLRSPLDEL